MNETPANPEGSENSSSLKPREAEKEPRQTRPAWKKAALMIGGWAIAAAGATFVTLAVTHKSAVTENAIAYVNGLVDGYRNGLVESYTNVLLDGVQACEIGP